MSKKHNTLAHEKKRIKKRSSGNGGKPSRGGRENEATICVQSQKLRVVSEVVAFQNVSKKLI